MENNTLHDLDDNEQETVLGFSPEFDTFPIVLAVCIAIFNSLVLFLATRVRSLRTVTNLILGSLAFSDLLSGILGIPFYLACSAVQDTVICGITQMVTKFFSISIVLHLLLVSVDRHVAVIHAIHYSSDYEAKGTPVTALSVVNRHLCRPDSTHVDWSRHGC